MRINGIRVFYHSPKCVEQNHRHAEQLRIVPGITAHGGPGAWISGHNLKLFTTADEARRIADDIHDAVDQATDLTRTTHTTETSP